MGGEGPYEDLEGRVEDELEEDGENGGEGEQGDGRRSGTQVLVCSCSVDCRGGGDGDQTNISYLSYQTNIIYLSIKLTLSIYLSIYSNER